MSVSIIPCGCVAGEVLADAPFQVALERAVLFVILREGPQ